MRLRLLPATVAVLLCLPALGSQTRPINYRSATLLSVKEREPDVRYIGQPSDAPLSSDSYTYEVSVQQGCVVYVGQWESDRPHFMSDLHSGTPVDVQVSGHSIRMQYRGDDMKMSLMGHRRIRNCNMSQ